MNRSTANLSNASVPVFKTGDYVQLTRAQDVHLPVGSNAMVNERFTDGIDFNRDAYAVTFDNDHDIVRIQDLELASMQQVPSLSQTQSAMVSSKTQQSNPPTSKLKRTIEEDNSFLTEKTSKKQKTSGIEEQKSQQKEPK